MPSMRSSLSVCALIVAAPALAQDIALDAITVEDQSGGGLYGETQSLDTGGITRFEAPIAETPRSVNVVTAQQMLERGATDIEDALSYSTGVNAGQWGHDARSDWYNIRGFNPTTFHDGLLSRYGYYNDVKPEPFLLESVEVLRGPASGQYGNGEVGGVVNTTSKTAATESPDIAQLSFGSNARRQVGADFGGNFTEDDTLSWRLAGLYRESETDVEYSQDDAIAIAPSLTWRPGPDTELTLLARYQKNDATPDIQFASIYGTLYDAPNGRKLDSDVFIGEPDNNRFDAEHRSLTALFSHRFNDVWSMDVNARWTDAEADYRHTWWGSADSPTRYNADGTINRLVYKADNSFESYNLDVTGKAEYDLAGWDMTTLVGATYTQATYDSDTVYGQQNGPIDPFDPDYTGVTFPDPIADTPANTIEEAGAYVQTRATWNDRLHLDVGARYSWIETGETSGTFTDATVDTTDDAVTANVALLYRFDNGIAPYASYAESFRQESLGTDASGEPFDPTRGEQYEIGVKYQPEGTDTLLSAAVFDLTKSNLTKQDPDNPGFQTQTGEATSRGIELEAKRRFGNVFVDAGYTWLETENVSGDRIAQVPSDFGSIWADWRPQGNLNGWSFGAGVRHTGEKWDGSDSQRTPPVTLYDAAVGWSNDRFDVRLNARNLADEDYVSFCDTATCYFGAGRSVALTGTMKF
ncbi:membrane protein [Roseivivax halodurans JCM 10272]|uniref:Membrane protein n=1 Tax=Roseivivax halodurans JCM 10272 TaxID=1449350 RepID=X7EBZ2_9RHOB|nr:TonB-dependent siderophore receptor [Roseivivax halodurans]ETX13432.1 membrane protein [Roseivivax halodurans JCM 10272]